MHLVCLVSVLAGLLISESRAEDCVIAGVGPGPGAGAGASAGGGKTSAGATAGGGKTSAGATAGGGKTSAGATAGGGKTSAGATAGGGKTSAGATAGGGKTSAGATAGKGKTSAGATAGGGETTARLNAVGETIAGVGGGTTTDPGSGEEITTNETAQDDIRRRRSVDSCAAYDHKAATADTNCSAIMKYIGCTFKQDSKSACSVPDAHHTEIVNRNCSGKVNDTCKCELDYYKSNLSTNMCTAMKNLEDCLNKASTQSGCDGERKADIHQFVTGRKTIACSTGGNIVAAVSSLLFCLLAAVYL